LSIVTNDAIIGVNQDGGGPASRIWKREVYGGGGELSLWQGGLKDG